MRFFPPLSMMMAIVDRIAALTCHPNRSPMIRMSGPVVLTTYGFSAAGEVSDTRSPMPSAACSRTSGEPIHVDRTGGWAWAGACMSDR